MPSKKKRIKRQEKIIEEWISRYWDLTDRYNLLVDKLETIVREEKI